MTTDFSKRSIRPLVPPSEALGEVEWPLERAALRLLWLLLLLCPFWWLIDSLEPQSSKGKPRGEADGMWDQRRASWVVGWLVLLVSMWLINPSPASWRWFFAFIASVRLLEVLTTGFGTILRQEQQARARNLVTIVIYVIHVTLIFAILDHSFAMSDFVSDSDAGTASRASDYLYISWSNVVTLDSTFVPQSSVARFLQVLTTSSSIFLLSVLLAYGIDEASKNEGRGRVTD